MKRLARALAEARGGNGGSGRISAVLRTDKICPWKKIDPGDAVTAVGTIDAVDQDNQLPTRAATDVASGWYPQAIPPPSRFAAPPAEGCSGRGLVEAPQRSSNKPNAGSLVMVKGGEGGQQMQPSLAWEATVGAAIRESSGASGGVRRRDSPRNSGFVPWTSNVLDDIGVGLAAFAPPAAAVRGYSPRRRAGTSSARAARRGSSRGSRPPDRWSSYSGEKSQRLACVEVKRT